MVLDGPMTGQAFLAYLEQVLTPTLQPDDRRTARIWRPCSAQARPERRPATAVEREEVKAGNPRLRTTLIQLAWLWLRNQPHSALTLWFHERVSRNGGRLRKTTIVALARKLLVALWKYVTAGVVLEGAAMTAA